MILDIFKDHNQNLNQLFEKGFAKNKLTRYKTCGCAQGNRCLHSKKK